MVMSCKNSLNYSMVKGIIYKTTCLVNGKVYIGQTTKNNPNYFGSGILIAQAIKKYGRNNFVRQTLIECNTQEELDSYEEVFIELFSSTNRDIGYNIMPGTVNGFGNVNPTSLLEVRKKISESNKGRSGSLHPNYGKKLSESAKKKMSESMKLVPISKERMDKFHKAAEEYRKIFGSGMKGKKHTKESQIKRLDSRRKLKESGWVNPKKGTKSSEETKRKQSESLKGRIPYNRKVVEAYNPDTGETLFSFISIKEASKFCNRTNVTDVLIGRRKTAGGYYWRYST
jgi:group I intron endonuclease